MYSVFRFLFEACCHLHQGSVIMNNLDKIVGQFWEVFCMLLDLFWNMKNMPFFTGTFQKKN